MEQFRIVLNFLGAFIVPFDSYRKGDLTKFSLVALVVGYDPSTSFAFYVATTDIFAFASLNDFLRFCYVTSTTAKVFAAIVSCTASIALPETIFKYLNN